MERIRKFLLVSAATCCAPVLAQQPNIAHFETIEDWRTVARLAEDEPRTAALTATFSAFGRSFEVDLELNRRIDAILDGDRPDIRAYRGALRNAPGSWARLVIASGTVSGLVWDGTTLYGVEPGTNSAMTMFRADDVLVPAGSMTCGMHAPADNAAMMFAELSAATPDIARAAGAALNLDLGIVSDPELGALYADPEAAMLIRVNNVDGIFSEQLGVQLSVQRADIFNDSAADPFSDTTNAEDLLTELAVYRGDTPEQDAMGLTHLFTGRDLDGSTVGIAYVGGVCAQRSLFDPEGRSFGAGLTQSRFGPAGAFLESLIAAHEIGHNFGAPHDGDPGEACAAEPATGFIMASSLDPTADDFSQCSIDLITANLPSASCLSPLAVVDVGLDGQSSVAAPLTETQFTYVVSATTQGLETAVATSVQLSFDPALTVVSLSPQAGTCGAAQSNVTCDLGDIPGSSTRTIDVVLQSNTPGNVSINGTVTTTNDANAGNDSFADTVAITAASDLALVTSAATITRDQTNTILATVQNLSSAAATNITLMATWSDGLEIDSATLSGNACSLDAAALSFDCQIASLAGVTNSELSIELRGIDTGPEVITLNVSALESDPNTANNSANLALDVVPVSAPPASADPPAADSGGGGSLGPLTLLALFGAWRRSRRHKAHRNANFS